MTAIVQVTKTGPRTYDPVEVIIGGQFVEGRTGSKVGVAAANSAKVLGVALQDAVPASSIVTESAVDSFGRATLSAAPLPTKVAVAYGPTEVDGVLYSAAAAFGDPLVITAGGQVAPAAAGVDARFIVARCTAVAGVAAGARGLTRLI